MQRREFLGAAAALSALPASTTPEATAARLDISSDRFGVTQASVQSGEPVFGAVYIGEMVDGESDISVSGCSFDEDPPKVNCTVDIGGTEVELWFSPDRAHSLAEELTLAANAAIENGDV